MDETRVINIIRWRYERYNVTLPKARFLRKYVPEKNLLQM